MVHQTLQLSERFRSAPAVGCGCEHRGGDQHDPAHLIAATRPGCQGAAPPRPQPLGPKGFRLGRRAPSTALCVPRAVLRAPLLIGEAPKFRAADWAAHEHRRLAVGARGLRHGFPATRRFISRSSVSAASPHRWNSSGVVSGTSANSPARPAHGDDGGLCRGTRRGSAGRDHRLSFKGARSQLDRRGQGGLRLVGNSPPLAGRGDDRRHFERHRFLPGRPEPQTHARDHHTHLGQPRGDAGRGTGSRIGGGALSERWP